MARPVLSPAGLHVDPTTGVLAGATGHYAKRLTDLRGLYADEAARERLAAGDADRIAYEVYDHRGDERCGDLIFGTSVLYPGRIGREYAMTRGHLHRVPDRTEIYHCLRGHGLLLMQTVPGDVRIVELTPGAVAYVAAHWIHRSVNVGGEPLVTLFCYPGDSGQDYDVIGRSGGMRRLVVDDGAGGWTAVDNPRWRPPAVVGA
jgi:glucose-6-phosphate isomerase